VVKTKPQFPIPTIKVFLVTGAVLTQPCIGVCHGLATIGSVSPVAGYPAGPLQCSVLEGKFMLRVSLLARG